MISRHGSREADGWPDRYEITAAFFKDGGSFYARIDCTGNTFGMRLDFALLAEAADTSVDGKVHILGGGFDAIAIPSIGFTAPPFAIVVRLSVDSGEYEDEQAWGLLLVKPDGSEKWIVEQGRLQFAKPLPGRRSQTQAIVRASFKFEELGKFELKVYGNGIHMSTLDMHVVLTGDEEKVV